jgi:hypothetical protein
MIRSDRIDRSNSRQQVINLSTYDPPPEKDYSKRPDGATINVDSLAPLFPDHGLLLSFRILGRMD